LYLTKEEEKIYSGEAGWVLEKAIKVVVKVGEALGADRLIPISHAHISGVGYANIGEAGLSLLRDLYSGGARFSIYITANPGSVDDNSSHYFSYGEGFIRGQREVLEIFRAMGVRAFTCTPYYYREPKPREILAWAESNAVLIANSIYGARSNREGGLLALFEAILGKTYRAGLLIDENRRPQIAIKVLTNIRSLSGFGALGLVVGEIAGKRIPYVEGIRFSRHEEVKGFLAAAGSSGGMGLVLIDGISPEAERINREVLRGVERITIDNKDLSRAVEESSCEDVDAVLIGCPHASAELIEDLALMIAEKGVRAYKPVWIFTSHHVYEELSRKGVIELLISRGVKVFAGICGVISPLGSLGYRCIATPSAKAAFYLPKLASTRYIYMDIPEIIGRFFR
jgi:predicted aconitase